MIGILALVVGILLGPMLIGLLKAILDTILSQPGWQWSKSVKPIVKTESCQQHHTG